METFKELTGKRWFRAVLAGVAGALLYLGYTWARQKWEESKTQPPKPTL